MSVELNENQKLLIEKIAKVENFQDYSIEATSGSLKGDNYLGVISTVKLVNKKDTRTVHLILKSAQPSEKLRNIIPINKIYKREFLLYEEIFPELEKFQLNHGFTEPFIKFAKCYGSCSIEGQECIIMENLKERCFQLWNRKLPMNSDHIKMVFKTYANLHSISFAMRELDPEKFNFLCKDLQDVFAGSFNGEEHETKIKYTIDKCIDAVEGNDMAKNVLLKFREIVYKFFIEDLEEEVENGAIIHGDCWNNNLLFKYENPSENTLKPTDLCLIDWQLSRKCTPIVDLSYSFCTAAGKEDLDKYMDYLKIYHETLSERLRQFGCDAEKIYPFEQLTKSWKKCAKFGFHMALAILKVILSDSEDAPDLAEMADSGIDIMTGFSNVEYDGLFKKRLTDLAVFMSENDLI